MRGNIEGGKLICDKEAWANYLASFTGDVSIKIEKWKKDRTPDQNKLYWKFLEIIGDEYGDNPNDLHEFLKIKFLPPRETKVLGKVYRLPPTTTALSTADFTKYLDRICALTGVPIPNLDIC